MIKKSFSIFLTLLLCFSMLAGCGENKDIKIPSVPESSDIGNQQQENIEKIENVLEIDGIKIELSDTEVLVNGVIASTDNTQAVYVANDIVHYEEGKDFTYGEGTESDAHSKEDADKHTVVHITKPGNYVLSGKMSAGQVAVDLGDEAKENPEAVVTLILNGIDITNTVAPGIIFYNVYECYPDATEETATKDVDTSAAGANVVIVDDTVNTVSGSYVARIYKEGSVILSEDGKSVEDAKKLHKYDAAFYSKMTMNINGGDKGTGILNIQAENEGLDSELHLTINGGIINIESGNDGINTNEDYVSVTTINGGTVNILVNGSTGEGDGIDSNGWLVINGGTVVAQACSISGDAGIDSDMGIHINGGKVFATGNMLDHISESEETFAVFNFSESQDSGVYTLKNSNGVIVTEQEIMNNFMYLIIAGDLTAGEYTLWKEDVQFAGAFVEGMSGMGRPGMGGGIRPEGKIPEGFDPETMKPMNLPEGGFIPEDGERPVDGDVRIPELPVGGMPGEKVEIPTVPSEIGNNWRVDNVEVGITGGSAITMERPEKSDRENMTPPEGGFHGSDAGFEGSHRPGSGSGWGAGSSEVSTTFNIVDGANYFVSVQKSVVVD